MYLTVNVGSNYKAPVVLKLPKGYKVCVEKVINREVTPVNKEKIAKLAQMWRLLPPNLEFWQFFAIDSCLVYILGKRQKFHEKIC